MQVKSLELISSVEMAFDSCSSGAIKEKYKETSMQAKEAIICPKKQNKNPRQNPCMRLIASNLGVAKSTIGTFLKRGNSLANSLTKKDQGR